MERVTQGKFKPRTSFCWQCCGKLSVKPGTGGKELYFELWTDPAGNVHAVHKICKTTLERSAPVNAQPRTIGRGPDRDE